MVERIFVEKLPQYDSEIIKLKSDIKSMYGFEIKDIRRVLRYDVEGVSKEMLEKAKYQIFSEPTIDNVLENIDDILDRQIIIAEYLDGQFDQRADSAAQCIQMLAGGEKPLVRYATVFAFKGLTPAQLEAVKKYLINPVDGKEGVIDKPKTLKRPKYPKMQMREDMEGFIEMNKESLKKYFQEEAFAMNFEDLSFVQDYFLSLKRNPTVTELKVIDTYWSDHCRHSTFLTEIKNVQIFSENKNIEKAFKLYEKTYAEMYAGRNDKYPCLMDVATIAVKKLRKEGYLDKMDISEEVNACSVNVVVDNDGKPEDWLIMFKNETHNHPTEIEPFGGAATCLGGAIRDPLSGRVYVYQALRLTGAGNPLEEASKTIEGKLPQRFLTKTALAGFASYGNQIGLATGMVHEVYHDRFKAKRMEAGYVIGGAPKENVYRKTPEAGDVVILVGGDTGRDGCGGATGSSKAHTIESIETCGAEVQKGNAPEERKLQRLFRDPELSKLIMKSNDFGAGGVCVAIGELADGLDIYLEKVPKKYDGLTATEIAISESQERMAVVVNPKDVDKFIEKSKVENLKATTVAVVTDLGKMRMFYEDEIICDLDRSFLDTNGVKQVQDVIVEEGISKYFDSIEENVANKIGKKDYEGALAEQISSLENCSRKGMGDVFDATVGAATVLLPLGGKRQMTPAMIMASKPPVSGFTKTVTCSSFGLYPDMMISSPFVGATYSVLGAVSKLIASGVRYDSIYMSFQEYFLRVAKDPVRWGQPLSALLGAFDAQMNLKIGSIGGKDSMSGTFEDIDVPPTLAAFAMGVTTDDNIIHNTFGHKGSVYRFKVKKDEFGRPDYEALKKQYTLIEKLIKEKQIVNSNVVEGSVLVTIAKSLLGNMAGIDLESIDKSMFLPAVGDIIVVTNEKQIEGAEFIGTLNGTAKITYPGGYIDLAKIDKSFQATLEDVFPTAVKSKDEKVENICFNTTKVWKANNKIAAPKVFMPLFPGTNCEYDMMKAFEQAGARVETFVVRNINPSDIDYTIKAMKKKINDSQIIAFPGGFSLGDEPDGSGKFIATTYRNLELKDAVLDLLYKRDGLAIGICNGFQALIKLGLVPTGDIVQQSKDSATLIANNIGRHMATMVKIRVASNNSPWLNSFAVGETFTMPVSNGEGRIIASDDVLKEIIKNGQVATQYCDENGNATMVSPFNPNGSALAIEGLLSPCGRVLGKMAHAERWQEGIYQNIQGNFNMDIFTNGVKYYS